MDTTPGGRTRMMMIDDGPALRMSSPGTPSSPAAFPNFIFFTAASTSLSSGAGSVLVSGVLVTGISLSGFAKRSCPYSFHRPRTCSGSVSVFPFLSFIELCLALKLFVFSELTGL